MPFKLIHLSKTINEIFQRCATLDKNSTDAVCCLVLLWYRAFSVHETMSPDDQIIELEQSTQRWTRANSVTLHHVDWLIPMTMSLAQCNDAVVCTMWRYCGCHWHSTTTSSVRRGDVAPGSRRCHVVLKYFGAWHYTKFCIWAGIAYKIGLVRHSSNSPMTNMHVCDGNELTPLGLGRGTKTSKLDAPGNAGWLATPAVICMTETGLYNLQMA